MAFPPSRLRSWDRVTQPLAFTREENKYGAGYSRGLLGIVLLNTMPRLQHPPAFPIFGDVLGGWCCFGGARAIDLVVGVFDVVFLRAALHVGGMGVSGSRVAAVVFQCFSQWSFELFS